MNDAVWFGVSLALMAMWWLVGYRTGLRAARWDEYNRIREYLSGRGALAETPGRKPPQGGSGTAPVRQIPPWERRA
jgi:hypothetical protein